jgi:hypothetical protein
MRTVEVARMIAVPAHRCAATALVNQPNLAGLVMRIVEYAPMILPLITAVTFCKEAEWHPSVIGNATDPICSLSGLRMHWMRRTVVEPEPTPQMGGWQSRVLVGAKKKDQ